MSKRSAAVRKLIAFTSQNIEYALALECAREVHAWTGARPLPCTPAHVRGVMNLRGTFIPVVDLRARFSQGLTDAGDEHVVIVVLANESRFGILVDKMHGILTARSEDISAPPASYDINSDRLFVGIMRSEDRIIGILDEQRLLRS